MDKTEIVHPLLMFVGKERHKVIDRLIVPYDDISILPTQHSVQATVRWDGVMSSFAWCGLLVFLEKVGLSANMKAHPAFKMGVLYIEKDFARLQLAAEFTREGASGHSCRVFQSNK